MQKIITKRINKILYLSLFFIIGLVNAKGQSLKEYKADTVYFYASNDEIEDCIISKRILEASS